ncbi:MAG: hypothetical protein ACLQVJ_11560 [Syntrophobacteraceae bacterium]
MKRPLNADRIDWLKAYADEVRYAFESVLNADPTRFLKGPQIIARFQRTVDDVLAGRGKFRAVDEAHNELCIAEALLANAPLRFTKIDYEPKLANCIKTIDFRAESEDGLIVFVDVKTIKPISKDRWDQYGRAMREKWFPQNVKFILDEELLGGELWHNAFAARSSMLNYSIELEVKIDQSDLKNSGSVFVLAFCGEGFHWHEDELDDFVSFYFSGNHRSDDPFSVAESKSIIENGIAFARSISRFASMRRPHGVVHRERLNWNVQAPIAPAFL